MQRIRVAGKVRNPRLLEIDFIILRHWKATMEFHRTKDILHVMRLLGHKSIKNTLIYTHLIDTEGDDYISKVARNLDEACKLIKTGLDYVCEMDNAKIFRKRK
jgi:site-specific recombinase XerC